MSTQTVLVIDDDETIHMVVGQILHDNDMNVISAYSGTEGLEKLSTHETHAILLDQNLPGMSGDDLLVALKNREESKDIPVIMLTGENDITNVSASLELGADDYIVKPFDSDNLIIRVKKLINP